MGQVVRKRRGQHGKLGDREEDAQNGISLATQPKLSLGRNLDVAADLIRSWR